jgi:hypothetical protein
MGFGVTWHSQTALQGTPLKLKPTNEAKVPRQFLA